MTSDVPPTVSSKIPGVARRLRKLVMAGILMYLMALIMLALLQRKLMFHPGRVAQLNVPGAQVRAVQVTTRDNIVLNGWHWSSRRSEADTTDGLTALFFSGNAGNRAHRAEVCRLLNSLGIDVLIFDYRGYAENAGSPSEQGLANDARAVWDYATQHVHLPPDRLLVYGESLGGGVATRLAAECCQAGTPPAGLILRSTFSSMVDVASYHYPWLPVGWLLVDRFPSVARMAHVTCPCLIFHGALDRIVPLALGRRLFEAVPQHAASGVERRFIALDSAGHNDVLATSQPQVRSELNDFLKAINPSSG